MSLRGPILLPRLLLLMGATWSCSSTTPGTGGDGGLGGTGGQGGTGGGGGSITAQAFVSSILQAGSNPSGCPLPEGIWLQIGNESTSVQNGASQGGNAVTVSCQVVAAANGFNVSLSAQLAGAQGGSIAVGSPSSPVAFPAAGKVANVAVTTSGGASGHTLIEPDCTFDYSDPSVSTGPGIVAGRVWGTLTCPHATDGSANPPVVCETLSVVKFENCAH